MSSWGCTHRVCKTSSAKALCQKGLSASKNFTNNDKNISHSVTWNKKRLILLSINSHATCEQSWEKFVWHKYHLVAQKLLFKEGFVISNLPNSKNRRLRWDGKLFSNHQGQMNISAKVFQTSWLLKQKAQKSVWSRPSNSRSTEPTVLRIPNWIKYEFQVY